MARTKNPRGQAGELPDVPGNTAPKGGAGEAAAAAEPKQRLRRQLRAERLSFTGLERKRADAALAAAASGWMAGGVREGWIAKVFVYASAGGEADTWALMETLWKWNVPVAAPSVRGEEIRFYEVKGRTDFIPGWRGIAEPKDGLCPLLPDARTLLLVPGLAFTVQGARLGQGGGFYDRFFAAHPSAVRLGYCYPFQVLDALPEESHDCRVQYLAAGGRVLACTAAAG